jgi:hypothetical protein
LAVKKHLRINVCEEHIFKFACNHWGRSVGWKKTRQFGGFLRHERSSRYERNSAMVSRRPTFSRLEVEHQSQLSGQWETTLRDNEFSFAIISLTFSTSQECLNEDTSRRRGEG